MNPSIASFEQVRNTAIDLALRFGPKVLAALIIIGLGVLISRWTTEWLARGLARIELEPPVRILLLRIARALVMILFIVMALQNLGIELLPLIAGVGIAGAGIALGLQGVLSNVAAGLSIIFTKPFRVTEYISIAGEEGRVEVITLFSTTLSHPDRSRVVIPNRKIAGEILHNFGQIRQLELEVSVAYDTDLEQAIALINDVLQANPRVLRDPTPIVQAEQLGAWAIRIVVKPWVNVPDFIPAAGELNRTMLAALRAREIHIPYPQQDVRILNRLGNDTPPNASTNTSTSALRPNAA